MYRLLVSQPSLNSFDQFSSLAEEVWNSGIMTHHGPKVQELESKLKSKWSIPNLALVTNGTVALEIGLKSLELPKGSEIITTAFTWIATPASIAWSGYKPVFADIDPNTLNIDPSKIEDLITENTSAIMAVHVFSNPCDVKEIRRIADKHNLKVIYDGAHSVGVRYKGQDLSQYGDVTTHSYHATKIYNTGEGGSIITPNPTRAKLIERLRFFGHDDTKNIVNEGTNGKMHEISACIGLANLPMLDKTINHRRELTEGYQKNLSVTDKVRFQSFNKESYNYSYMPIIFDSEDSCIKVFESLKEIGVLARRYFYPSMDSIDRFKSSNYCHVSRDIASRILCLPCHDSVTHNDVIDISNKILETLRNI